MRYLNDQALGYDRGGGDHGNGRENGRVGLTCCKVKHFSGAVNARFQLD